jgi:hypothetical protein
VVRVRAACTFAVFALSCSGCFAPLKSPEIPSAIEQEMASAAIDRSVAALQLNAIDPRRTYLLQIAAPTGVDTALIRARLQQRLAEAHIRLEPETATRGPTLLAVLPYAGIDWESSLIGIPFVVPGLPVPLGDISLYKSSTVTGRARVELSAWSADRAHVATVPPSEASRYYRYVTVLTLIGPFRFTNLVDEAPGDEP